MAYSSEIADKIKQLANKIGLQLVGITDPDLTKEKLRLQTWLTNGNAGNMQYLHQNLSKRLNPCELVPNTQSILTLGLSYPPIPLQELAAFALLPDYHTTLKNYLRTLIAELNIKATWRIFAGSGPILTKALAAKAGLGWIGKNTLLINRHLGSYLVLGTILTDLKLPYAQPSKNYCGTCTKCCVACPTGALTPYQLDARKCIAYLTIENRDAIPYHLRSKIGTHIFGCDICQNVCPWNHHLVTNTPAPQDLTKLFLWDEATFLSQTATSPIHRISYAMWLRNIAVALGNSQTSPTIVAALKKRQHYPDPLVAEHVSWALQQHANLPS